MEVLGFGPSLMNSHLGILSCFRRQKVGCKMRIWLDMWCGILTLMDITFPTVSNDCWYILRNFTRKCINFSFSDSENSIFKKWCLQWAGEYQYIVLHWRIMMYSRKIRSAQNWIWYEANSSQCEIGENRCSRICQTVHVANRKCWRCFIDCASGGSEARHVFGF